MCDLINWSFEDQQSKISKEPESKPFNFTKSSLQINSIVEIDKNHFRIYLKSSLTDYSFELITISEKQILTVNIQILQSNGNLFKITSAYLRSYLNRKFFLKKKQFGIKVHPISGLVHFQVSTFLPYQYQFSYEYVAEFIQKNFLDIQHQVQILLKIIQKKQDQFSLNDPKSSKNLKIVKAFERARQDQNNVIKQSFFFKDQQKKSRSKFDETKQLINTPFNPHQQQISIQQFKKQISNLQRYCQVLQLSAVRRNGSNLQQLLINQKQHFKLFQKIKQVQANKKNKQSLKVNHLKDGNIFLNLQKQQDNGYLGKRQFLQTLPRGFQYTFIDKYYKLQGQKKYKVLILLALKQEMLDKFLNNNRNCMSFQSKLRIFVQIANCIQILWAKQKYILCNFGLGSISITKNLTIKIKNFHQVFKVQKHILLQDKQFVNNKRLDSFLCLSRLYFNLFYEKQMVYLRPSRQKSLQRSFVKFDQKQNIFDRISFEDIRYNAYLNGPTGVLASMNYIFLSYTKNKIHNQRQKRPQLQFYLKDETIEDQNIQENQMILSNKSLICWLAKILDQSNNS